MEIRVVAVPEECGRTENSILSHSRSSEVERRQWLAEIGAVR